QQQDTGGAVLQRPAQLVDGGLGLLHLGGDDDVGRPGRGAAGEDDDPEVGVRGDRRAVDRAPPQDPVGAGVVGIDVDEGVGVEVVLARRHHAARWVDHLDEHRPVAGAAVDRDDAAERPGPGPGGDVLRPGQVGLVDVADQRAGDDLHQAYGAD